MFMLDLLFSFLAWVLVCGSLSLLCLMLGMVTRFGFGFSDKHSVALIFGREIHSLKLIIVFYLDA